MVAVGKKRIVRDINVVRVRTCPDDFTQYREPAKAGIEYQNRRRCRHTAIIADPELPSSCYCGFSGSPFDCILLAPQF